MLEDFEPVEFFKGGDVEMCEGFEGFRLGIAMLVKVGKILIIVIGFNGDGFEVEVFDGSFLEEFRVVLVEVEGPSEVFRFGFGVEVVGIRLGVGHVFGKKINFTCFTCEIWEQVNADLKIFIKRSKGFFLRFVCVIKSNNKFRQI